jgi:glycosyltransferase involved in cell wall biosynthesis
MKIGIDTSALTGKATGTSRYIKCLIERLIFSGRETITFSPNSDSFSKLFALLPALKHGGLKKHLYRNLILKPEMMKAEIDCAIFPDYFIPPGFMKPSAAIIHDISFITHPQFYSKPFIKFYLHQMKSTLKQNPVIATISEYSKDQISRYLSIPKKKILLLQAYSDFSERNIINRNGKTDQPYFLYVGHVEPRKNLNYLIENFIRWNEERKCGFKLKIVGELWIKSPEIKLMLNKYKNHPLVEFTGYVDEEKLDEAYRHASAFVHTSFVEGFGMPVLEAMHYRLPVLCTSDSATEEISKPYSVPVDPYRSESLARGLDTVTEKIPLNGRMKYQIKYSHARMQTQLNNILEILEKKIKGPCYPVIKKSPGAEEAVEKTLLYARLFNTGVKKENLHSHLFDVKLSRLRLEEAVDKLYEKNRIVSEKGVLYLNNHFNTSYKGNGKQVSGNKKSKKLLKILKTIPFISLISFSGGTAHYGFENHNDIDLFIITKPNTAYISYFVIHLLSLIFKARKELCANYIIDETNIEIKNQKDFYTAHQIITLTPYKNHRLLHHFWKENEWIKEFFPNFSIPQAGEVRIRKFYIIFKPFNKILKNFYTMLYKNLILRSNNSSSLRLTDDCIKLHTNDHRFKTANEFAKAWDEYLSPNPKLQRIVQSKTVHSGIIQTERIADKKIY